MATIVIAVFILIISSFFFGFQSMPQLYKLNAVGRKFFWIILVFFLVTPCILLLFYYILSLYRFNIWLAAPVLFLALIWLFTGFFAKIIYKTLTEENPRRKRVTLTAEDIKKRYRFSILFFILAAAIWCFGIFIGFGRYDYALIILFLYFIIQGVAFILGNRKALRDAKAKASAENQQTDSATKDAETEGTNIN